MKTISLFAFSTSTVALAFGCALTVGACDPAVRADADASDSATIDGSTSDAAQPSTDASSTDATASDSSTTRDAAGDSGALTAGEKAICDARASRAQCSGGAADTCSEETKCLYARITETGVAESYAKCHGFPSCKGDDGCIASAGEAVGGQAARDYTATCLAKGTECGAAFPGDELCSPAAYAYKGVGAAATACLAKPCADQKACFEAALKPIRDCKAL